RSSIASSMSQETAHIDSSGSEGSSNAQSAIMFSIAPLTSLPAMTPPVDPDPAASFRDLVAVPPDNAREAPHIDPRRMRTIVDRGVSRKGSQRPQRKCGPRYADSGCNNNDDRRGSLFLLSDNEEGLLRLSVSNGAIGPFHAVFLVVRDGVRFVRTSMRFSGWEPNENLSLL